MSTIGRDQILAAARNLIPQALEVPALGGTVHIRPLTLAGMARFSGKTGIDAASAMLIECLCDDNGGRLFSAEDVEAIGGLPRAVAEPIIAAINAASGIDAKTVETAEGK
jgi:hypothetical protein